MQVSATEIRIPVPWGFIAAKSWGNSDGYPVIAVHGTMDNAASFDFLAPMLPRKFQIVAVDLPGHGQSSHYPDGLPYHFTEMLAAIKRVVRHFKWETCYYIGHSFGGTLGVFFAAMYPEIVKKLVMLDILTGRTYPLYFHPLLFRTNYETLFAIESKIRGNNPPTGTKDDLLLKMKSGRVARICDGSAMALLSRCVKNDSGHSDGYYFSNDQKTKASIHIPLSAEQMRELLGTIRCELLVVQASESPGSFIHNGALELLEIFKRCCPKFQIVTVKGRHDVHMDDPVLMAPTVSKFLLGNSSL